MGGQRKKIIRGIDINLYLDKEGKLVITTDKRNGLQLLGASADLKLDAKLEEPVFAWVKILVSEVDIAILKSGFKIHRSLRRRISDLFRKSKHITTSIG